MTLRALCILHPGFEEIEAITPIDLLRRAGVEVTVAGIHGIGLIEGKCDIRVQATVSLADVAGETFDLVVLPGGPGIQHIREHPTLCQVLRRHADAQAYVACICAAPLILLDAGLIEGLRFTAHPSTSDSLPNAAPESVVVDRQIITSKGAGTATQFSLQLIEMLLGPAEAKSIAESICWPHS